MKRLILGCGYVGMPVARAWNSDGDQVFALTRKSSRAAEFSQLGLIPLMGDVTEPNTLPNEFPGSDTVLIAIGMDRSRYDDIRAVYVNGMRTVLEKLPPKTGHLIYISSTGVYGDFGGQWVDEEAPTRPTREGGKACLEAEALIADSPFADRATILRLSGIYGPHRVPSLADIKSKSWSKLNPQGYLNLIHLDDIVNAVLKTAECKPMRETILIGDGNPPERRIYYETLAEKIGVGKIDWPTEIESDSPRSSNNKRISNEKMQRILQLDLSHPNFESGLSQSLGN